MAKYSIPVSIQTCASTIIGVVECDSLEEFHTKSNELWESQDYDSPSGNITCDFDLGDWDISVVHEEDLKYYKEEE